MPTLTVEQSKKGAIRSAEARRANALELARLRARVKEFESALPAQPVIQPIEVYTTERITRTRKQIETLSSLLDAETDPQRIDRLASALARLSEIERQLAGRPLPGSLKPSSAKQSRAQPVQPMPIPLAADVSSNAQAIDPQQGEVSK